MLVEWRQYYKRVEKVLEEGDGRRENWEWWCVYHQQQVSFLEQQRLGKVVVLGGALVMMVIFWGWALDDGGWWWLMMMVAAGACVFFGYLVFLYQRQVKALQDQNRRLWQRMITWRKKKKNKLWEMVLEQVFLVLAEWVREKGLLFKGGGR